MPAAGGHVEDAEDQRVRTTRLTPWRSKRTLKLMSSPSGWRYLETITRFHARVGVKHLLDGYQLDGAPFPGSKLHLAAFVAGASAAAMAVDSLTQLRDEAYEELVSWDVLLGASRYYNKSWSVLGTLMLTGQFTNLAMTGAQGLSAKQ